MRRRIRPIEVVKHVIWLAVVLAGIADFALRLPRLGAWSLAGMTIGGAMLVIYLLEGWAPAGRGTALARRLGDGAVLIALVTVCLLLLALLLDGLRQLNLVRVVVVGLFLVTFANILRDFVRRRRERGSRRDAG